MIIVLIIFILEIKIYPFLLTFLFFAAPNHFQKKQMQRELK